MLLEFYFLKGVLIKSVGFICLHIVAIPVGCNYECHLTWLTSICVLTKTNCWKNSQERKTAY